MSDKPISITPDKRNFKFRKHYSKNDPGYDQAFFNVILCMFVNLYEIKQVSFQSVLNRYVNRKDSNYIRLKPQRIIQIIRLINSISEDFKDNFHIPNDLYSVRRIYMHCSEELGTDISLHSVYQTFRNLLNEKYMKRRPLINFSDLATELSDIYDMSIGPTQLKADYEQVLLFITQRKN